MMDPPSTQVFGGPWGGRDLPSVGGRFPSLQRHGVIRKGRLHKPPDSPQPLPLSCVLYIRDLLYCTVPWYSVGILGWLQLLYRTIVISEERVADEDNNIEEPLAE